MGGGGVGPGRTQAWRSTASTSRGGLRKKKSPEMSSCNDAIALILFENFSFRNGSHSWVGRNENQTNDYFFAKALSGPLGSNTSPCYVHEYSQLVARDLSPETPKAWEWALAKERPRERLQALVAQGAKAQLQAPPMLSKEVEFP